MMHRRAMARVGPDREARSGTREARVLPIQFAAARLFAGSVDCTWIQAFGIGHHQEGGKLGEFWIPDKSN
jgi:hypothetical protein